MRAGAAALEQRDFARLPVDKQGRHHDEVVEHDGDDLQRQDEQRHLREELLLREGGQRVGHLRGHAGAIDAGPDRPLEHAQAVGERLGVGGVDRRQVEEGQVVDAAVDVGDVTRQHLDQRLLRREEEVRGPVLRVEEELVAATAPVLRAGVAGADDSHDLDADGRHVLAPERVQVEAVAQGDAVLAGGLAADGDLDEHPAGGGGAGLRRGEAPGVDADLLGEVGEELQVGARPGGILGARRVQVGEEERRGDRALRLPAEVLPDAVQPFVDQLLPLGV